MLPNIALFRLIPLFNSWLNRQTFGVRLILALAFLTFLIILL